MNPLWQRDDIFFVSVCRELIISSITFGAGAHSSTRSMMEYFVHWVSRL